MKRVSSLLTISLAIGSAPWALGFAPAPAAAQQMHVAGSNGLLRLAPPRTSHTPTLDGKVDPAEWNEAAVLDSFTEYDPVEGVRDTLGTVCLVMYDDANLYIAFQAFDDPANVQAPVVPRDQISQGDWVGVNLDTYHDHQRSMFLCSNAAGVQMDGVDQDGRDSDFAPDLQYTSRGHMTEHGYEVEMSIPFKSLRFANSDRVEFGFNAMRRVRRFSAQYYWAPIKRDINSFHTQLGTLEAIQGVRPGRNLELTPTYTATKLGLRGEPDAGADRLRYDTLKSRMGFGAQLGLTSNLIADATVTPDFSQVEADAGVVDINQRFAIFFPEKRPFFLEGSDIFTSPISLVYTRRIVDPRYGVKLTGKAGHTTIGILQAADRSDGREIESLPDHVNPYFGHDSNYSIARFRQDVLKNSYVGVLLGERQQRDDYNRTAGFDGRLSFRDRYAFTFQDVHSWAREQDLQGEIAGMDSASRASVSEELLGLTGAPRQGNAWRAEFTRDTRPLNLGVFSSGFSPDFAADMGFITRTDTRSYGGWVRPHLWAKDGQWFTALHAPFNYERIYDYTGRQLTDETYDLTSELYFPRNQWIGTQQVLRFTRFNGIDFPRMYRRAYWAFSERYRGVRPGVVVVWGDQIVFGESVFGRDFRVELSSDLRFSPQFDASLSFLSGSVWREVNDAKYATVSIPRARVSYQFTKELAVRAIAELRASKQYDTSGALVGRTQTLTPDLLLSYNLRPGTVVYLGYGSQLQGRVADELRPMQSSFFTKLSYLWQV